MNLDEALQTFIVESRELLEAMEGALLSLGQGSDTAEAVNAIFRAAHTIKGSAGLFGLDGVVAFTHVVESVLDDVRSDRIAVDDTLLALLLRCGDHIGALVGCVEAGHANIDPALTAAGEPLLAQLGVYLETPASAAPTAAPTEPGPAAAVDGSRPWHISVRFGESVLRNGMDPLSFIRYLGTLGEITSLATLPGALPDAHAMDPESCYLGFEIGFKTRADQAAIEGVFEFVLDDCTLQILPHGGPVGEVPTQQAPAQQLGSSLMQQGRVAPAAVDAAPDTTPEKQPRTKEASKSLEAQSVRVDAHKLDRLIDLVGELIIASAGASLAARRVQNAELHESHSTLASLVEEVRDNALQLRMVKIGATFNRFQRVVHDVSREIGKDITLAIHGEDTELDKTVVEKIGDPLTHLVRNSMDHGIEPAELRAQRGKPARGTVTLNAYHDSGSVVIEVGDDGGGLNRDRILAKAIERGLVEPGRNLTDGEIYGLIFEPGFSTAEQVTSLSGRGVGMDVVKRNIAALRGTVSIASEPGVGTTVTVRLPLTLAIINGFQVGVGKAVFVVPLDTVDECVEFSADEGHDFTNLRGEVLPFLRLRELFETGGAPPARENIVVIRHAGQRMGLVVDTLLGEFQTVIKPLSKLFSQVRGIGGSSIRGSGEVALILDVPALMQQACAATRSHSAV